MHLYDGACEPLSGRAVQGTLRTLFLGLRDPHASPALPRLPRGGGSSSGGRAGASPSRPVTRHPGSARPHPGSSLFPRRAPRSGAASSSVALWRFGAPPSMRPGRALGSVHWPAPNQGTFCLVSPVWTPRGAGRRRCAQPGAGAGECPGRGQVEPAPGEEEKVEAGALGLAVLEPELRAGGRAGRGCPARAAFGDDAAVRPPGSPAPSGVAHAAPRSRVPQWSLL